MAQPLSIQLCVSTLREGPPTSSAQPSSWERNTATSRTFQYGACGSQQDSSASSHTMIKRRSLTGANTAVRVPTTNRLSPRSTEQNSRYRRSGPSSAESTARVGARSSVALHSCLTSQASGTTTSTPPSSCESTARTRATTSEVHGLAGAALQTPRTSARRSSSARVRSARPKV